MLLNVFVYMFAPPAFHLFMIEIKKIQRTTDGLRHQLVNGLGPGVKRRDGWRYDRAHLRELGHGAQMAGVQRCFAYHQDQATTLLERHIGRPREQGRRDTCGDL